jgi:hypothetical protein
LLSPGDARACGRRSRSNRRPGLGSDSPQPQWHRCPSNLPSCSCVSTRPRHHGSSCKGGLISEENPSCRPPSTRRSIRGLQWLPGRGSIWRRQMGHIID